MRPSGALLLRNWQDFFRVRRDPGAIAKVPRRTTSPVCRAYVHVDAGRAPGGRSAGRLCEVKAGQDEYLQIGVGSVVDVAV